MWRRCHDHLIEWAVLWPAMIAVAHPELSVRVAMSAEPSLRLPRELDHHRLVTRGGDSNFGRWEQDRSILSSMPEGML